MQYATHRMTVRLPAGLSLCADVISCDYSMRLFIEDMEVDCVGVPGDSRESTVPQKDRRMYSFASDGEVMFIAQAANFVHREGAWIPGLTIGTAENISRYVQSTLTGSVITIGALLAALLYHLGLFILNRRRIATLLFSVCCLLLLLHENTLIPMLFHDYNWYLAIRLEYLCVYGTGAFMALLIQSLYPLLFSKWVMRGFYALSVLSAVTSLILEPAVFSRLIIVNQVATALMMAYILAMLAISLRTRNMQTLLSFVGIGALCVCAILDMLQTNALLDLPVDFLSPIGMMFFVFCYAMVLSIEHAETERKMLAAQKQVKEAEERYNAMLEAANAAAYAAPSDFGLSSRETDVLWLLLDGKARAEIAGILHLSASTVNTYCSRIYKKTNAASLQELFPLFGIGKKAEKSF